MTRRIWIAASAALLVLVGAGFVTGRATGRREDPGRLFRDPSFQFEALRVLDHAAAGGADIQEVLQTVRRIRGNDEDSWYEEWLRTARAVETRAKALTGDGPGRGQALGRAHNYYRAAAFFLPPADPRRVAVDAKMYETFYRSLDTLGVYYEVFEVPYANATLPAVFYPGPPGAEHRPLIVAINGYDSVKEELYYVVARAAYERGYSVLTYDGPGQGAALREHDLPMTPEWEKPNRAVLDAFAARHGDPPRTVLLGYSLGGILAPRAAAFDPRVDGVASLDVYYDFALAATWDSPAFFRAELSGDRPPSLRTRLGLDLMMRFDRKIRWAMTHGAWVMGAESPWEVMRAYRAYTLRDAADDVTCDVLLFAGEKDHFVPRELLAMNEKALVNARSVRTILYDEASGGQEHCQMGAATLWWADFFQWIEEIFGQSA